MSNDKTLATVKHGGCVQLASRERERFKAWWDAVRPLERSEFHYEIAWAAWQAAQPSPGGQDALASGVVGEVWRLVDSDGRQFGELYDSEWHASAAQLRFNGDNTGAPFTVQRLDLVAARQPVGEPVAVVTTSERFAYGKLNRDVPDGTKLYAAPPAQAVSADGFWLAVDDDGFVHFGQSTDDGNGGVGVRENVESRINDWLDNEGRPVDLVWAGSAPAQAVDLGLQLDRYDAGLLGDGGGWWQDYIRAELDRAHEFYQDQADAHG